MSDELLSRLAALDEPRPLPPSLTARLERVLTAHAEGMADVATADTPRPIPQPARDRMEETLVRVAVMRPLPGPLRHRLEQELVRPERTWRRAAVAAAVLFLVATTAAYVTEEDRRRGPVDSSQSAASGAASDELLGDALDPTTDGGGLPAMGSAGMGSSSSSGGAAMLRGGSSKAALYRPYPTPPYANVMQVSAEMKEFGGPPPEVRDPPRLAPLRIGVVGGDDVQEAGFRAYIALANAQGGAGGHRLDLVEADAGNTVATVNLSDVAMADDAGAPPGTRTPLVESVDVVEAALRHAVFDLSSVPERQAHLAVSAALGTGGAGTSAVIYTAGAGPFASRVPDALELSLRARGVGVVRVRWNAATPAPLVQAGVAFVSLPTDEARSWLRAAKAADYRPSRGIWGVWSLVDESLLVDMSANVRALSPYELVAGDELHDVVTRTGKPASARLVHGWATAKWMAVSIWSSRADDNIELARALAVEDFASGFSPWLEYRDGTHSRLPEAIVLKPEDGRLVREGDFRRDE